MKAKSGDLVEITWPKGTTSKHRVSYVVEALGVVFTCESVLFGAPWENVRLIAAGVDITPVEAHAVYSLIVSHLPPNFTTDQKAALESVLNKIQRVARAAEDQS